jgi:hypothetical protein
MRAKAHKPPFYISLSLKASAPGQYVVCDIQGPFGVETLLGEKYVVTYTDWYSRHSWTYLLKAKSEAVSKLKDLVEVSRVITTLIKLVSCMALRLSIT